MQSGSEALPGLILACLALLVKMLKTLKPHGIRATLLHYLDTGVQNVF